VRYGIDVVVKRCRTVTVTASNGTAGGGGNATASCVYDVVQLSPTTPTRCYLMPPFAPTANGTSKTCDLFLSLEGDFGACAHATITVASADPFVEPHALVPPFPRTRISGV